MKKTVHKCALAFNLNAEILILIHRRRERENTKQVNFHKVVAKTASDMKILSKRGKSLSHKIIH